MACINSISSGEYPRSQEVGSMRRRRPLACFAREARAALADATGSIQGSVVSTRKAEVESPVMTGLLFSEAVTNVVIQLRGRHALLAFLSRHRLKSAMKSLPSKQRT